MSITEITDCLKRLKLSEEREEIVRCDVEFFHGVCRFSPPENNASDEQSVNVLTVQNRQQAIEKEPSLTKTGARKTSKFQGPVRNKWVLSWATKSEPYGSRSPLKPKFVFKKAYSDESAEVMEYEESVETVVIATGDMAKVPIVTTGTSGPEPALDIKEEFLMDSSSVTFGRKNATLKRKSPLKIRAETVSQLKSLTRALQLAKVKSQRNAVKLAVYETMLKDQADLLEKQGKLINSLVAQLKYVSTKVDGMRGRSVVATEAPPSPLFCVKTQK